MVSENERWRCRGCGAYLDQFQTAVAAARADRKAVRRAMRGQIVIALVLILVGLGITIATSPWASHSAGTWFVAFGPIAVGGAHLFRILVASP
jgi:hypothetical protein